MRRFFLSFAFRYALLMSVVFALSACSVLRTAPAPGVKPASSSQPAKGGGYYKDDGPGDDIPVNLDEIPNAVPRVEPLHKGAVRPYTVLGRSYVPHTKIQAFRQEGVASWYGKKFHGQKTSIGETYDMFAMTAAHTTLALPSYARVTNPKNGRSVVVRVNDRGPFHAGRIIDLSYTAAHKLGFIESGSGSVVVESIVPGTPLFAALAANPATTPAPASTPAPAPASPDSQALDALALRFLTDDSPDAAMDAREDAVVERGQSFFLQLGAFSQEENAENLRERLLRELDWLSDPVFIHSDGNFYRLQTGPYATRATALEVAERISTTFGQSPTLVIR